MSPALHSHSYYEILYPWEDGFFLDLANGEVREVHMGELCLIPFGVYHGTRPFGAYSKKLALRFGYSKRTDTSETGSLFALFDAVMHTCKDVVIFSDATELADTLDAFRKELLQPLAATEAYREILLNQFYLLLMRRMDVHCGQTFARQSANNRDDRAERQIRIEKYFHQYYSQAITEEHMAQLLCLSKRQVSRILRELYATSFRQILIEVRLNRAAQLLLSTDNSIEEIAESVGYTSLSGFYTAFRQKFGVTAGKYRTVFSKNK